METINIDDTKAIVKKYKLRNAGAQNATIEITLPKQAVEREARRLGVSEEEAVEKLTGVWRYNSFRGLHLDFEVKTRDQETEKWLRQPPGPPLKVTMSRLKTTNTPTAATATAPNIVIQTHSAC